MAPATRPIDLAHQVSRSQGDRVSFRSSFTIDGGTGKTNIISRTGPFDCGFIAKKDYLGSVSTTFVDLPKDRDQLTLALVCEFAEFSAGSIPHCPVSSIVDRLDIQRFGEEGELLLDGRNNLFVIRNPEDCSFLLVSLTFSNGKHWMIHSCPLADTTDFPKGARLFVAEQIGE